jgi:hypothetical protein
MRTDSCLSTKIAGNIQVDILKNKNKKSIFVFTTLHEVYPRLVVSLSVMLFV